MAMTYFRKMTKRQAATALAEYLAERPVALEQLRDDLVADPRDPDSLLDGTRESLTPLWRWVATRIMTMEDPIPFDPDAPAPTWWPSWARYSSALRQSTPDEVVTLLDGFISYLGDVVTAAAPEAVWQVGNTGSKHMSTTTIRCSPARPPTMTASYTFRAWSPSPPTGSGAAWTRYARTGSPATQPDSSRSCAARSGRSLWWKNQSWKSARRTGSSTSGCTKR